MKKSVLIVLFGVFFSITGFINAQEVGEPLPSSEKVYRIGTSFVMNSAEKTLKTPGISVIRANSKNEAGEIMKKAFPKATRLHKKIDSGEILEATVSKIRNIGFDVVENPTNNLGDAHARLIHPDGAASFDKEANKLETIFE